MFTKSKVNEKIIDEGYGDFQQETTRLESDFVINSFKNIHKNHKINTHIYSMREDGSKNQDVIIRPGSDLTDYLTIQPSSATCPVRHLCAATYTISPHDALGDRQSTVRINPVIDQVPFVLATKGMLFRRRGTPYFTTRGNPTSFITD